MTTKGEELRETVGIRSLPQLIGPAVVVGVLWVAFAWFPANRAIDSSDRDVDLAQTERLAFVDELAGARQLEADWDGVMEQRRTLELAIPADLELDAFIRLIDEIAVTAGARVEQFSPVAVETSSTGEDTNELPAGVTAVDLNLALSGTYSELAAVVEALEKLDRAVVFDNVSFTADEENSDVLTLDSTFRIFTLETLVAQDAVDRAFAAFDDTDLDDTDLDDADLEASDG